MDQNQNHSTSAANTLAHWRQLPAEDVPPSVASVIQWIISFVANPDPRIGRPGPVCPIVPQAIRESSIFISYCTFFPSRSNLREMCRDLREKFLQLSEKVPNRVATALLLLFPSNASGAFLKDVEDVQQELKPWFMEKATLIGKFHPLLKTTALKNPSFQPSRSPAAFFAVRYMVENDIHFLRTSASLPTVKAKCLEHYLAFLGDRLDRDTRASLAQEIAVLKGI